MTAGEILRVLYQVDKTAPILVNDCGWTTYANKALISTVFSKVTIMHYTDDESTYESNILTTKKLIAELEKVPKMYMVDAYDGDRSYGVYAVNIEEKDFTERIILYV